MKKLCLFVFVLLFGVFTVSAQSGRIKQETKTNTPPQIEGPVSDAPPPRKPTPIIAPDTVKREIPDFVVYGLVFRLAQTGWSPAEQKGPNPLILIITRKYKAKKILTEAQEKSLRLIAYETLMEVEKLDKQGKTVIEEFGVKNRNKPPPSEPSSLPPEKKKELLEKRVAIYAAALEKLKTSFGEKDFAKFTEFVDENIRSSFRTGTVIVPE